MYLSCASRSAFLMVFTFVRSFFKKWLDLERRLGDDKGAISVKRKAIEWTQKAANLS